MSKIVDNFLIPLFAIVSVLYVFNSLGNIATLHKVYHHKANDSIFLERANIAFYFSGNPQLQEIKNKKIDEGSSYAFFFTGAVINKGECETMVKKVNDYNDCYKVTIEEVIKPKKGILLVFNFDQSKFAINYELFDSIGLQKGIVFRLYNKDLIKQLEQTKNKPILRTLWQTNKPRVAIDFGHGGYDSGAIGYNGIQEKQICLSVGKMVSDLLEQHGCDVILTRSNDNFIPLDERTLCAHDNHADLFVSIHANYSSNPCVMGIETFCLQPSLFVRKFSQLSDEENLLVANLTHQRARYSCELAQLIQKNVCRAISPFHDEAIDRKVKYSVAQVLLGSQMPSVLVELGFVSHKKELMLLNNKKYQKYLAKGICDGVLTFIKFSHSLSL